MALPPLPSQGQSPWFDERTAWDEAVESDLENRLSEANLRYTFGRARAVDVLNHGWVVGSNADQTAILQAAVNEAGVDGTVLIPNGLGYVDGTVTLMNGTTIAGASGRGTTLRSRTDSMMFYWKGGQGQQIRNLRIQHWQTGPRTTFDIDATNATRPVIDNVEIVLSSDSSGSGGIAFRKTTLGPGENSFMPLINKVWIRGGHLLLDGVTDGMVSDTWIWGPSGTSNLDGTIHLRNISNGWSFVNCQVIPLQTAKSAWYFNQSWDTNIIGGYIDGSYTTNMTGYGITLVGCGELFVSAMRFFALGRSAIRLINSDGNSFSALGFTRNNKQDNFYPDIELYNSSYNTFLGMSHSQRDDKTNKGRVYWEDTQSTHNLYDNSVVNLAAGDYYAAPWFVGNPGTLGTGNRPSTRWPRPSSTPYIIAPPGGLVTADQSVATWPATNRGQYHRFHLSEGGVYRYASFRCSVAGGNVQSAVVRMDGTYFTRVMSSAVTPSVAGHMALDMGSTFLPPGEYALVLWADNTTFQTTQITSEMLRSTRLCGELVSSGGIPASGMLTSWSTPRAVAGITLLDDVYSSFVSSKMTIWRDRLSLKRAFSNPTAIAIAGSSTPAGNPGFTTDLTALLQDRLYRVSSPSAIQRSATATFTNNLTAGIHVYNAAEGGTTSANYLDNAEMDRIAALNPALIIHMVGANDYTSQVNPATMRANLAAKLAYFDTKLTQPCQHLFIWSYAHRTFSAPTYPNSAYASEMLALANGRADCSYLNVGPDFAARGVPGADPDGLILPDDTHLTVVGNAFMRDLIFEFIFNNS